jgi:hypothetical protein
MTKDGIDYSGSDGARVSRREERRRSPQRGLLHSSGCAVGRLREKREKNGVW